MRVNCAACPLRPKPRFIEMTREEVLFMQDFKIGELDVERGTVVLLEGSNSPQLFTVFRGMGLRYKTLADGRRQVLNFVFPGDFLGLQAGLMQEMKHSVEASTKMTLCVFDRKALWKLFREHPSRAYDLTWIAAEAEHFLGDALATVGQKGAEARIAWALVRIFTQCEALDLTTGHNLSDAVPAAGSRRCRGPVARPHQQDACPFPGASACRLAGGAAAHRRPEAVGRDRHGRGAGTEQEADPVV